MVDILIQVCRANILIAVFLSILSIGILISVCYNVITVKGTPVLRMQAQSVADQAENSRTVPLTNKREDMHMSQAEIITTITELQELRRLQEELEAEIQAAQDKIKTAMGDAEELRAGAFKVTYKAVTSSRLDTTALKKLLPEVAERFMKTTTTRCFQVQ